MYKLFGNYRYVWILATTYIILTIFRIEVIKMYTMAVAETNCVYV